jgi:hypothetical protein
VRAVGAQPFLAQRDRGAKHIRIGLEQRAQDAALMQIDDDLGERLDAAPLGAENENEDP